MFSQRPFHYGAKGQANADTSNLQSVDTGYGMDSIPNPVWRNDPMLDGTERSRVRGQLTSASTFNVLDLTALLVSLVALALSIAAISPSLPYAARLQYPGQIIVIGFLLGIMNQAMSRVVPWFCLVLERRVGSSSLQNFDGLLRWSPFSNHLHLAWRIWIITTLALPLALSVLYKRYTGGIGHQVLDNLDAWFSPIALPGLDENVPGLSIMANATVQFLVDTRNSVGWTTPQNESRPYGYNLISVSNTSAAALDIPVPGVLRRLQDQLGPGQAYYLNTTVRGTVATYSTEFDNNRDDDAFWNKYTSVGSFDNVPNYDGYWFGMLNIGLASGDDPSLWDDSWIFLGNFVPEDQDSDTSKLIAFRKTAQMFQVRRHDCVASLKIVRSAVQLLSGSCSPDPLPWQFQYYQSTMLALAQSFLPMLQQALGPNFEKTSPNPDHARRLVPTYAAIVASLYQSRFAMSRGTLPMQENSELWVHWMENTPQTNLQHPTITDTGGLNETYLVRGNPLSKTSPTLRPDATLYLVLAAQPLLILIAYFGPFFVAATHRRGQLSSTGRVNLPRKFTLVEVLAGIDRDSLRVFSEESPETVGHRSAARKARKQVTLDLQMSEYQQLEAEIYTTAGGGHHRIWSGGYQPRQRGLRSIRYILKPRHNKRKLAQHAIHLLPRSQVSPPYSRAVPNKPFGSRSPSPSERPILNRNASSIGGMTTSTIDGFASQHEVDRYTESRLMDR